MKPVPRPRSGFEYIYREFYCNSSSSVLVKLYLTLILPILTDSSSIWDPHSTLNINKLEKVQHFALKLSSKNWTSDYPLLLQLFNLSSLSSRRTTPKLVILYKYILSKFYIPAGSFSFQNQLLQFTFLSPIESEYALPQFFCYSQLLPPQCHLPLEFPSHLTQRS